MMTFAILFFPWTKDDVDLFRSLNTETKRGEKEEKASKIAHAVIMTDSILSSMGFENSGDTDSPFVSAFFTEEDWEKLKSKYILPGETEPRSSNWKAAENLKMLATADSVCRGWLIDVKKLVYYRLSESSLEIFKGKVKHIKKFEELEKWVEDFKFKFAAKKFGI